LTGFEESDEQVFFDEKCERVVAGLERVLKKSLHGEKAYLSG
jgi:hypothetical protein